MTGFVDDYDQKIDHWKYKVLAKVDIRWAIRCYQAGTGITAETQVEHDQDKRMITIRFKAEVRDSVGFSVEVLLSRNLKIHVNTEEQKLLTLNTTESSNA